MRKWCAKVENICVIFAIKKVNVSPTHEPDKSMERIQKTTYERQEAARDRDVFLRFRRIQMDMIFRKFRLDFLFLQ